MLVFALFDAKQDKATVVFDEATTLKGGLEKELLVGQGFSFNKVNFLVVSLSNVFFLLERWIQRVSFTFLI